MDKIFSILADLVKYIPAYLSAWGSLMTEPITYLCARARKNKNHLEDAFVFAGITFVISILLRLPLYKSADKFVSAILISSVFGIIFILVVSIALSIAWRLVRKPIEIRALLTIVLYWFGLNTMLISLIFMGEGGVLIFLDQRVYLVWRDLTSGQMPQINDPEVLGYLLRINTITVWCLGLLFVTLSVVPWTALAAIAHATRRQSFGAVGIFVLFYIIIALVVVLAELPSLFPTQQAHMTG